MTRAIASFIALLPMAAHAQVSPDAAMLRTELESLKAEQAKTNERIARIEAALDAMQGNKAALVPSAASPQPVPAAKVASPRPPKSPLDVSGDLRLRFEGNFGDSDARSRNRAALRARLRASYSVADWLTVGGQVTTGDPDDPNSSDVTFSNFGDDLNVSLDQAWLRARFGELELTGGKIPQPFVRTEMVWDNDVFPEGLAAFYAAKIGSSATIKATGLYFIIDEAAAGPDSDMLGGQLVLNAQPSKTLKLEAAAAYYDYTLKSLAGGDVGDFRTNRLADGRYLSDFNLLDVIGSATWNGLGERWPLKLTANYVHNFGATTKADSGFSAYAQIGRTAQKGDWRFSYTYAAVETDAVLAAFSEDNTTVASNVLQHGFAIDYVMRAHLTLNATYYHFRPWRVLDAGANEATDWLNRLRINVLVEF